MESMPDISIVSHFKDLPDTRIERAKKHRLIDIIVIALGSIMVGGDGFKGQGHPPKRPPGARRGQAGAGVLGLSSRSNSASAAKIPKNKRPLADVVPISAPAPASTRRPTSRARSSSTVSTKCFRSRHTRSRGSRQGRYCPAARFSGPGQCSLHPEPRSSQMRSSSTPAPIRVSRCISRS